MYQIIPITDFDEPGLEVYASLSEKRTRIRKESADPLFVAESPTVIEKAVDAGCRPVSVLMDSKKLHNEHDMALIRRCGDIPIYTAEEAVLKNLTGFHLTRGMMSVMKRPRQPSVEEICRNARRVAVLENIANATNLGAIFRSAAALNIDAVLLTADGSDPLYRRASRVSMGAVFLVPWTHFPKGCDWVKKLKELGFQTAALALGDDTVPIYSDVLRSVPRMAIILGTEGTGLRKNTVAACDYSVGIPMAHDVDSLNVAAASAIAFYQLAVLPYR